MLQDQETLEFLVNGRSGPCIWWPANSLETNSKRRCSVEHITRHSEFVTAQAAKAVKLKQASHLSRPTHLNWTSQTKITLKVVESKANTALNSLNRNSYTFHIHLFIFDSFSIIKTFHMPKSIFWFRVIVENGVGNSFCQDYVMMGFRTDEPKPG